MHYGFKEKTECIAEAGQAFSSHGINSPLLRSFLFQSSPEFKTSDNELFSRVSALIMRRQTDLSRYQKILKVKGVADSQQPLFLKKSKAKGDRRVPSNWEKKLRQRLECGC